MIRVVCSVLITQGKSILLVTEKKVNKYGLPGGKLEVGETLRECAVRETQEEIGVTVQIEDLVMVSQKPYTHEGNTVIRYIYRASVVEAHKNTPELNYEYFSEEQIKELDSQEKIRGKDVMALLDDYFNDRLVPLPEPTVFA